MVLPILLLPMHAQAIQERPRDCEAPWDGLMPIGTCYEPKSIIDSATTDIRFVHMRELTNKVLYPFYLKILVLV